MIHWEAMMDALMSIPIVKWIKLLLFLEFVQYWHYYPHVVATGICIFENYLLPVVQQRIVYSIVFLFAYIIFIYISFFPEECLLFCCFGCILCIPMSSSSAPATPETLPVEKTVKEQDDDDILFLQSFP